MRLSMFPVSALIAVSVFYLPAHSAEIRAQKSEMVGEIPGGAGHTRQLSFGSVTPIDIDPDLIARGDRLDLYKIADDGLNFTNKKPALKRVGSLFVLSGSGSQPVGKVIKLSEEIDGKAYVAFSLPANLQLNQYLPFLKSMADTFPLKPETGPLKIAVIDATDPFGDRTELTDALFEDVILRICERPQFLCVNRGDVAAILRKRRITTSRNIDSEVERELLSKLGVELIVTGAAVRRENKIDLLLKARSTRNNAKPRQVWRLFRFNKSATGVLSKPSTITYRGLANKRGRLKIRLLNVGSADGLKVEYFFYKTLSDHFAASGIDVKNVQPVDFFIKLNGSIYRQDGDGLFYRGSVKAGKIRITAGYYPEITIDGETKILRQSPVQKTFTIYVGKGDNFHLDIIGTVEKGFAIIAGDSYLSEKNISTN
ncbi:hypothetical protein MNBD_NITROSPINAE03-282 [hydrothermal vent metagenome]|uniref:Uncharacterized protein n=1 Tax=hydrothermal vent metagenome TaxID=652676 RepID=A0A3B1BP79_9ZZZZ